MSRADDDAIAAAVLALVTELRRGQLAGELGPVVIAAPDRGGRPFARPAPRHVSQHPCRQITPVLLRAAS